MDCLCDSSFFLPAPAWWQWDSISCSNLMSARKPYRGCVFWEPPPFAALGFIKYNGMTAEKFVWAWFKSEFLMPKKLTFRSTNTYYEMMKPEMEHKQKEVLKAND